MTKKLLPCESCFLSGPKDTAVQLPETHVSLRAMFSLHPQGLNILMSGASSGQSHTSFRKLLSWTDIEASPPKFVLPKQKRPAMTHLSSDVRSLGSLIFLGTGTRAVYYDVPALQRDVLCAASVQRMAEGLSASLA